jgi:hypothetical protein
MTVAQQDRTKTNQGFKSRAMSTADRNSTPKSSGQGTSSTKQGGNADASSGGSKKK